MPSADDILVAARSALLDALLALGNHTDEVTIIGAQAIYLHTGAADVSLAEAAFQPLLGAVFDAQQACGLRDGDRASFAITASASVHGLPPWSSMDLSPRARLGAGPPDAHP